MIFLSFLALILVVFDNKKQIQKLSTLKVTFHKYRLACFVLKA